MARIAVQSEAEVIEAVAAARAAETPFEIVGNATKRGYGRPMDIEDVLDVSALCGIVSYEPDELVITARANTLVAEIEDALAPHRQRLGFDPANWGPFYGEQGNAATIGGVLSCDACGSARIRFGAARDHLLGYRAVNGFAEAYKAGGHVVKNVTGFDLPILMCGAMGTLGVLTEVTLRVLPRAPASATLVAKDIAAPPGFALLRRVWTSPFEATGLAYIPACAARAFPELGDIGQGAALIRLEGASEPLKEKIAGVTGLLSPSPFAQSEDGDSLFARIGNGAAFTGTSTDAWRLAVPPASGVHCAKLADAPLWIADWAGGLLWMAVSASDDEAPDRLRATVAVEGGSATLTRASDEKRRRVAVFQPEQAAHAALTKAVKTAFDPFGLCNPGRMIEGI